jgi:predicted ATPase
VWVSLAPLTAADQVANAIAAAIGVPVYGATAPEVQLLEALRERAMLLVLDNLEHLPGAVELLAAIVRAAPDVRLLVTSRERLRLQDEHVYSILGLALPDSRVRIDGEQRSPLAHERAAAVLLFLERAARLDHSFALSPQNRSDIARICELVAGVPLAIELAAAWTRTLSCAEIAAAIAQNLDFLTLSDRDVAPRHQSLRAVFDHSWQLLQPPERTALACMSVFRGGCRADSVAAIAGVTPATLAALSDASLLRRSQDTDGSSRYDLHELVRHYAAEHLTDDLRSETEQRHMRFYANLLQAQMQALQSDGLLVARAKLDPDRDNVRVAWEHAVARRDLAVLRQMSRGMTTLSEDYGWLQAASQIFGGAVAALRMADPTPELSASLGQLLSRYGYFVARSGRLLEADVLLREALQLLEASTDPDRVHALTHLCSMSYQLGRYADARRYGRDAVAFAEASNNPFYKGLALCFLLMTAVATHDDAAAPLLAEALALWRANGSPRGLVLILSLQSSMRLAQGSPGEALALAREALRLNSTIRGRWLMAFVFMHLGMAALAQGDGEEARYLCRESAEAARALADPWLHGQALNCLGWTEHAARNTGLAAEAFAHAARIGVSTPSPATALHALLGLATLAVERGQSNQARTWLGAIVDHSATEYGVRTQAQALYETLTIPVSGTSVAPRTSSAAELSLETLVDQAITSVTSTQER